MHQSLVFCLASLVLPCVATASSLSSDVPFCTLRFGVRYTQPDRWAEMRAALAILLVRTRFLRRDCERMNRTAR